tara:strand:+ start:955 stop:1734 length:780 start_codon:yes stop_codon:yes gene_type:complete
MRLFEQKFKEYLKEEESNGVDYRSIAQKEGFDNIKDECLRFVSFNLNKDRLELDEDKIDEILTDIYYVIENASEDTEDMRALDYIGFFNDYSLYDLENKIGEDKVRNYIKQGVDEYVSSQLENGLNSPSIDVTVKNIEGESLESLRNYAEVTNTDISYDFDKKKSRTLILPKEVEVRKSKESNTPTGRELNFIDNLNELIKDGVPIDSVILIYDTCTRYATNNVGHYVTGNRHLDFTDYVNLEKVETMLHSSGEFKRKY